MLNRSFGRKLVNKPWFYPTLEEDNKIWTVTIKGLVFNDEGKLLLLQEVDHMWELPGGRIEHGEGFVQTLKREIKEEMGVECEVLDTHPHWAWPEYLGSLYKWRIVLGFRISLTSFDFIKTDECIDTAFFDKQGLIDLDDQLHAKGVIQFL